MKQVQQPQMEMLREEWKLTLQGESVLIGRLSYPRFTGDGRGVRAINRYYRRVAETWKRRWNRELYCRACLDLADRGAAGKRFQPWQAELTTCVTLTSGDRFSLWQETKEQQGNQPPFVVRRGDSWNVRTGAPITLASALCGGKRWRRKLLEQLVQQVERRLNQGESLLFQACPQLVKAEFDPANFWLEEDGLRIFYPPEVLGSRVEGTVVFAVSVPGQE
ncbi:MAG: DUF3298 domain-containing protein [Oscillospiraceae bacterium]|nr:DUF3298 domain-containing protein [Oscillospiraceae bacterium]